ncbi:MAG: Y-family DNA polymerase [Sutterella sp.]|nr:Y-family DNA polymerase [Sutterella sp.]
MARYALIDGNTFYASCERIFRPDLAKSPIVVLSNNDGCIVTLTAEAKALGLKRGMPLFQGKAIVEKHNVVVFSSNYELYHSISQRMMRTIASLVPRIEPYSIDECFADLTDVPIEGDVLGQRIRERVLKWVGIPTCVGIAPTKTLAKLANHLAKKVPALKGVLDWEALGAERQAKALRWASIEDVWGIGRSMRTTLEAHGVRSVWDFTQMDARLVRRLFGVVGERIHAELRGLEAIPFVEALPQKKQICRSRSFAQPVRTLEPLISAASTHVEEAAVLLRAQHSLARTVSVFFHTSPYRLDLPQHSVFEEKTLALPTDDTSVLTGAVLDLIQTHFEANRGYRKLGITLSGLVPVQKAGVFEAQTLFDDPNEIEQRKRRHQLMKVIDGINRRFGRHTISPASTQLASGWEMLRAHKSPNYTTDIRDVPVVY